uniref:rhomboid-related protein 2 isoform X3 n=1 Tax=Gasterosteus aculeatus aculeatus TaxID=481459 RepID=UPI001A99615E|nr:rhomboid-related protein 2 isoform X3 [Gasterosteus aculeatus aculeatus]
MLAVFIYYAVWKPQKQWVTLDEGIWKSPLTYKPEVRQEAWRFISYMFVHAGVQHIFGNLVMQLLVGIPLELVHKGFEVGMVYMAGVLAGQPFFFNCISYFIFVVGSYWSSSSEPDSICVFPLGTSGSCFFLFVLAGFLSEVPLIFFLFFFLLADASRLPSGSLCSSIFDPLSALVGASGGVYALIGGYFMNAVVNFREMIPVLGVFRILAIVIFVATDFGFAFYRRFLSEDAGLKVSFVAHFGGIVAGMTVGYVFFSAYNQKLLKDPRFWLCIVGYLLFLIFAVVFNIVLSPAP